MATLTVLEQIIQSSTQLRPGTQESYLIAVREFLAAVGTHQAAWTGPAVEQWRDGMLRRGLHPNSVNSKLAALHYVSRRWAARDRNAYDFAGYAERIRVTDEVREQHAATVPDAQRIVATCRDESPQDIRDCAILILGLRTGCRRSSMVGEPRLKIRGIRFDDIDVNSRQITICLKGGRMHTMPPVDEETWSALMTWREFLRRRGVKDGYFIRGIDQDVGNRALVSDKLTPTGLYKTIIKRAARANIGRFTPHTMRHTFVTWMRELDVPDIQIAAYTGHMIESGAPGQRKSKASILDTYTDNVQIAAKTMPTRRIPKLITWK